MDKNLLFYGDNLDILREEISSESVDLIYLDPPFNSNRSYNVLFGEHGKADQAQIQAFDDTWTWSQETERQYFNIINGGAPTKVADAVQAMHGLLGENDVLAYLVMMAARLVELHRVLKMTGSIYLHCDPTASHYLKILMDAVFGAPHFRNEVIWKRTFAHGGARRLGPVHDVILFYSRSDTYTWNPQYVPYSEEYVENFFRFKDSDGRRYRATILTGSGTRKGPSGQAWRGIDPTASGRHWAIPGYVREQLGNPPPTDTQEALDRLDGLGRVIWPDKTRGVPSFKQYLDDFPGAPLQDVWTDIPPLSAQAKERLGFPTQKPVALLRRIIASSSNAGDVVLDPFCGCGTTVVAAQELARPWIGIDITYIAVDLMRRRLDDTFGSEVGFDIRGIPRDLGGADALFKQSPFDFERWAVSLAYGQPNEKQVGDRGVDGVIRFPLGDKNKVGRVLVSVKGGSTVNPAMVRDLHGAVTTEKAAMGVLITMTSPTAKMNEAASHTGSYVWPVSAQAYPQVQIVTIQQLLDGARLAMPPPLTPYVQAGRHVPIADQLTLGRDAEEETPA